MARPRRTNVRPFSPIWAGIALVLIGTAGTGYAQLRGVKAQVESLLGATGVRAGDEVRAALQVELPGGFHVQSDQPRDPSLIPTLLLIDPPPGVTVNEVVYPSPSDFALVGSPEPLAVFDRVFAIGVRFAVSADLPPGDVVVPGRLRYQACNDTTCFAPVTADVTWTLHVVPSGTAVAPQHADSLDVLAFGQGQRPGRANASVAPPRLAAAQPVRRNDAARLDDFTILGSVGGYIGTDDFLTFIHNAEQGVQAAGLFDGRGPLAILLIVLVGGLALNLTPCVLPMIPINLAIIGAGARAGSRRRGLLLGGVYGLAMALVYGALGLVVILTAGTFGTINASPWFNAGIALLFVVLGLAMFDVFTIDFSRWSSGFRPGADSRGTLLLSFTMGGVAALLAGACVAPVVIQVVLFSSSLYATGTTMALALPFVLGVGMALPWPFAGAGLSALPKPGAWMVRVKQGFGVLILGTAAYYGYLAYGIVSSRWVDPASVAASVEDKLKAGWHANLSEGLAVAQREGKPVLIDMWATWCKNCLTMDATTLAEPSVVSALDGYVKIKFQAEDPGEPATAAVMQRFGAVGLPAYGIIRPANLSK